MDINQTIEKYWLLAKQNKWSLNNLIDMVASLLPDKVAIKDSKNQLTYQQLKIKSLAVAQSLLKFDHCSDIVAVSIERSYMTPAVFLGVMKAAKAYVYIDPNLPKERIKEIIADAKINTIVLSKNSAEKYQEWSLENKIIVDDTVDVDLEKIMPPPEGRHAYVIYTSGTTGKPKGVSVLHSAVINNFVSFRNLTKVSCSDKGISMANFSFDSSILEVFYILAVGGTLYVTSETERTDMQALRWIINKHHIGFIIGTPTFYKMFTLINDTKQIRSKLKIVSGGEVLSSEQARILMQYGELYNVYGPSEATIYATACQIIDSNKISIGQVIRDASYYIVKEDHAKVNQPGEVGELLLGGELLASGYVNNKNLTRKKFIPNPYDSEPEILYKTGDLVYQDEDGYLYYQGRLDNQVKVRGHRIELQDIESVLDEYSHNLVNVVCLREYADEHHIVVYVISNSDELDLADKLRVYLNSRLPDYMQPSFIKILNELPMTSTGKIDIKALPDPRGVKCVNTTPLNKIESEISLMCTELLGLKEVDRTTNLYRFGANSLLLTKLAARISHKYNQEVSLKQIFLKPTVRDIALLVDTESSKAIPPLIKNLAEQKFPAPLSFQQEQVLFLTKFSPRSIAYNTNFILNIEGEINKKILERALTVIVERQKIFRTKFVEQDGILRQEIIHAWEVQIPLIDLSNKQDNEAELSRRLNIDIQCHFDISDPPLLFWKLYKLAINKYVLLQVEHHFVHDGWSVSVLMRELTHVYNALLTGKPISLKPMAIDYADFSHWQRSKENKVRTQKQLQYWLHRLVGSIEESTFPIMKNRPPLQTFNGDLIQFNVAAKQYSNLRVFARENSISLFTVMFTAYLITLKIYSGQNELIVGTGFANRKLKDLEPIIGMMVNTLPIRMNIQDDYTIKRLLKEVNSALLDAQDNQEIPMESIIKNLKLNHDPSKNLLFQTIFSFHDSAVPNIKFGSANAELISRHNHSSKFDMNIVCIPRKEQLMGVASDEEKGLTILWEYNTDLYNSEKVQQVILHYLRVLHFITQHAESCISNIQLMSQDEFKQIVYSWNETGVDYQKHKTIQELFEEQVLKTPDALAVICEHEKYTYREINEQSNRLARHIRALYANKFGEKLKPDTLILLCLDRSVEMLLGILAILKAGGAYVPINSSYPSEQVKYILEDTKSPIILAQQHIQDKIKGILYSLRNDAKNCQLITVDEWPWKHEDSSNLMPMNTPNDLAYVIYTSGTTGTPKGVMIEHSSVNSLLFNQTYIDMNIKQNLIHLSNSAFDASVFEIYLSLFTGGTLILPKEVTELASDLDQLEKLTLGHNVTTMFLTKVLFEYINQSKPQTFKNLLTLIVGGETLNSAPVNELMQSSNAPRKFFNAYGPTESTVYATLYECLSPVFEPIPIGKPLRNRTAYILDKNLQPLPIGVTGELHLGGAGLARGYLNNPDLTAKKFILNPLTEHPDESTDRLYKTGDLARWLPDGNIEFIGRKDHQVKMRGFRIELDEIEHLLSAFPGIKQVAVSVKERNSSASSLKYLVAYYVGDQEITDEKLASYLEEKLPNYMMPNAFVRLTTIPMTVNGKLDQKSLPMPEFQPNNNQYLVPAPGLEESICKLWQELLGIERVCIKDHFFRSGGDSILALQLTSRINNTSGALITVADIFKYPVIDTLINHIKSKLLLTSGEVWKL